jgi:hypothetical protein
MQQHTIVPSTDLDPGARVTGPARINQYLARVEPNFLDLPEPQRRELLDRARARIDLELELLPGPTTDAELDVLFTRLGDAQTFAHRLRTEAPLPAIKQTAAVQGMMPCRTCRRDVSVEARSCPHCGAPFPARQEWNGVGFEWKSKAMVRGLPLVHVAVGRDAQGRLRVAKGVVAVGQFARGGLVVAQFGAGAIAGIGQFVVAPISISQFSVGLIAVGQFAFGLLFGLGMVATGLWATGLMVLAALFRGG